MVSTLRAKRMSKEQRMKKIDELLELSENSQVSERIDWDELGIQILEGMGFDELKDEVLKETNND